MIDLLHRLATSHGPSGDEGIIRDVISQEISKYVDEVRTDALGNLIATKRGSGGRSVMLAAHMDEIGCIITFIDEKGYLRFSTVGGLPVHYLLARPVRFKSGLLGSVGTERIEHIKELAVEKMFIDIGAGNRQEAEKHVCVGDLATYSPVFHNQGTRVISKAMDDRAGCCVLIKVAEQLRECVHDVHFCFTVQEELGLRGARTAAFALSPDVGIAVDVTGTGDTPKGITMDVSLGKGAAIKVMDESLISHPRLRQALVRVARDRGIPYQLEVLVRGGTDAGVIQISKEGIPAGVVSIPCRYVHSGAEMVDTGDMQATVDLICAYLATDLGI